MRLSHNPGQNLITSSIPHPDPVSPTASPYPREGTAPSPDRPYDADAGGGLEDKSVFWGRAKPRLVGAYCAGSAAAVSTIWATPLYRLSVPEAPPGWESLRAARRRLQRLHERQHGFAALWDVEPCCLIILHG